MLWMCSQIPAMDGFFKVCHYYTVIGDWEAALETSARCRRLFPLDADAHTLFYCLLIACNQEEKDSQQSESELSVCESLVSILQCDPMCTQAARQLVKTGQHNLQVNHCKNPEIQVWPLAIVHSWLYKLTYNVTDAVACRCWLLKDCSIG